MAESAVIQGNLDLKGGMSTGAQVTPSEKPATLLEAINGKLGASEKKAEPEAAKVLDSERFAALSRKEKAIVKQQQQLIQQKAQIDQQAARIAEFESLKGDPIKALAALGITYDQLTNYILNGQKATPDMEVKAVRSEVEMLRAERAAEKKEAIEREEKARQAELEETGKEFVNDINTFVEENKSIYELVSMHAGQPIIKATIEQHFKNTGKVLGIDEAAKLVEEYLEEQIKKSLESSKFKAKQEPKDGQGQPSKEMGLKQTTSTLNNGMTSSAPTLLSAKTEADRIQRAMAALSKQS